MTNSTTVGRGHSRARRILQVSLARVIGVALAFSPMAARAQSNSGPNLPDQLVSDDKGFDLLSKSFQTKAENLSIGDSPGDSLEFSRLWSNNDWHASLEYYINASDPSAFNGLPIPVVTGVAGFDTISLTYSNGVYSDYYGLGKSISASGSGYVVYLRDGTKINFDVNPGAPFNTSTSTTLLLASSVVKPNGQTIKFYYKIFPGTPAYSYIDAMYRLTSVVSSNGYELKFEYPSSTTGRGTFSSNPSPIQGFNKVTAIPLATVSCDPNADSCPNLPSYLPSLSYATSSPQSLLTVEAITDNVGKMTQYTTSFQTGNTTQLVGIRRPGDSADSTTVTYGQNGVASTGVTSIKKDGVLYNYAVTETYTGVAQGYPVWSGRTVVRTAPSGETAIYKAANFNQLSGRVTGITDGTGNETTYTYDSVGRLASVRSPEGDAEMYSLDGRGNVLSVTRNPKPGSGLTNSSISASYDSACANAVTCNQPNSVTDAKGNVTNYVYDQTHGGLLKVTHPAAPNGLRPEQRYTYTALQAVYMNSAGVIAASGYPTYKLSSVSACRTTINCTGTADETLTTFAYVGNGSTNNLAVSSQTVKAGDGSVAATTSYTYNDVGDKVSVDGPLPGSDDTTVYRYDASRQLVGTIDPDPDGAGPRVRRATKITYNANGLPTVTETGTVNGLADADWAAFATAQQEVKAYDSNSRLASSASVANGTTYAVEQSSYDANGRLDCTAVRMNGAAWGTLPQSACTPQAVGSNGSDRITKYTYDNADRKTKVTVGYGSADQADEEAYTYTPNGEESTVTDGNGNITTTLYDGFDRVSTVTYPGSSYEQNGYDANGNVASHRLRDGSTISYTYDNLDRMTTKTPPNGELAVSFGYDLADNRTAITRADGNNVSMTYDALGRETGATSPIGGTVGYQYDAAGNRVRLTWGDGFYVTYGYDKAGNMTSIAQNGTTSLATFSYDDLGRRTSITRANGVSTSYSYDNSSRLATQSVNFPVSTNNISLGFGYNPANQIIENTRSNDNYAWTGAANVNRDYAVNGLNQYTSAGNNTFSYDGRGNLVTSGSTTFTYSSENLLTASNIGASILYDPLGRLLQMTGSATTRFGYDDGNIIAEYDTSNTLQHRYVFGATSDELLVEYDSSGNKTWLVTDERGSVVTRTDASGNPTAVNRYDEYGIPQSANSGRFQYTGQAWMPELGMYYYKARIYSPTLGRFLQTDPIVYSDSVNWYNYVGNDPVNRSDSSGKDENYVSTNPGSAIQSEDKGDIVVTAWRGNGLSSLTPAPSLSTALNSVSGVLINVALAGAGQPGPLSGKSAADKRTADAVNKLRQNLHITVSLVTKDGTHITLTRNGSTITGTISSSMGSADVRGTYVDVSGRAEVLITNLQMKPSIGSFKNPPSQMTLGTNTSGQIFYQFNRDIVVTLGPISRTLVMGNRGYQVN